MAKWFFDRTLKLVKRERIRRDVEPKISRLREAVKTKQRNIQRARAQLRHLSRLRASQSRPGTQSSIVGDATRLRAKFQRIIKLSAKERHGLVNELSHLESEQRIAIYFQEIGERHMFKAWPAFLRNSRIEYGEDFIPRRIRYLFRLASDLRKGRLEMPLLFSAEPNHGMTLRTKREEAFLDRRSDLAIRDEYIREIMVECYAWFEEMHVQAGMLPSLTESADVKGKAASSDTAPPPIETQSAKSRKDEMLQKLAQSRRDMERAANEHAFSFRPKYSREREEFMLTYRGGDYETSEGDSDEDAEPDLSLEHHFDKEFFKRAHAVHEKERKTHVQREELKKQAIEEGIHDPAEPLLFGAWNHPDDGFCATEGTSGREEQSINQAMAVPGVEKWRQFATGPIFERLREPSEVHSVVDGAHSSIRFHFSTTQWCPTPRWLVARWEAERVVRENEEEKRRMEWYERRGEKAPLRTGKGVGRRAGFSFI